MKLFCLNHTRDLGERVAAALGTELAAHEEREFEDGEHKARPLESVRGDDVFVVQSLYGDPQAGVDAKLLRLLFFVGALRDGDAARVTAVLPYLAYARKDRRTKPHDPVTTRYVAELLEAAGADRVVAFEVHNPAAFENAFRRPVAHLSARTLWVEHFAERLSGEPVTVVSPDVGGAKRAEDVRAALAAGGLDVGPLAFMEKQRSEGRVSGEAVVGEVGDRHAIVVDDLVSTGTTLARAARACRQHGARRVYTAAAHGLFVGDAGEILADEAIDRIVITDSVPPFRLDPELIERKITVLETAPLFGETIRRLHTGESITDLIGG